MKKQISQNCIMKVSNTGEIIDGFEKKKVTACLLCAKLI